MKLRNAFSMIELIFVIVVMGIIGKFGVEFLAQAYDNYIFTSINSSLQANSESAVELISTRLQHRIKDSIIAKESSNNHFLPLNSATEAQETGDGFNILEWVATDAEGFRGNSSASPFFPNWSGIVDLDLSLTNVINSPETNTTAINDLIETLSYGDSHINDAAIYFVGSDSDVIDGYGWSGAITDQSHTMHPITSNANPDEFTSADGNFSRIYEYYKLAWTAYAVVHSVDANQTDGNLTLYYDYQPWNGETYTDGKSAVIMEHVDTFRFMAIGSLVKIQVCVHSDLLQDDNKDYSLCKEKTIY